MAIPRAHMRKLEDRDHQLNNDMREIAHAIVGDQKVSLLALWPSH